MFGFFPPGGAICCQHCLEYLLLLLLRSQTWLFRLPPTPFRNKSFCIDTHTVIASETCFPPKTCLYITVTHLPWSHWSHSHTAALHGEERKKEELSYNPGLGSWGVPVSAHSESTEWRGQQWGPMVTSSSRSSQAFLRHSEVTLLNVTLSFTKVFCIIWSFVCSMTFIFFLLFSGQMLFSGMAASKEVTVKTHTIPYVHVCWLGNHKVEKKCCILYRILLVCLTLIEHSMYQQIAFLLWAGRA